MSRLVIECPMCGAWSGPSDGDASEVRRELCEECAMPSCCRCGSKQVYTTDDYDQPLCLDCYSAQADAVFERLKEDPHAA